MAACRQCDVASAFFPPSQARRLQARLDSLGLVGVPMGRIGVNIYFRRDHPVLDGWVRGEPFPFRSLSEYPFLDYVGVEMREATVQESYPFLPKERRRRIYATDLAQKSELIHATDAFSIGISRPDWVVEADRMVAVPIPDCYMHIYSCCSLRQADRTMVDEYLQLVREELDREKILLD